MRQYPSQQNSFEDGMQKDTPLELIKPNQYIEAQNLRIVSVEAGGVEFNSSDSPVLYGKSFKLTNLKGDLAYFQLPNTPTCVKRGLAIDAQEDLVILGWYATATELILITTAYLNKDAPDIQNVFYPTENNPLPPVGVGKVLPSIGQIWRLDISDYEAIPLNPTPELVYNDYLNLYLDHQIQQVYLVESDCIRRLFWTDNYNPPRNLELSQVPERTQEEILAACLLPTEIVRDPELLDFNPKVAFGKMDFLGYGSGGDLPEGVYQYTYRY
jgi:hypothetical protein